MISVPRFDDGIRIELLLSLFRGGALTSDVISREPSGRILHYVRLFFDIITKRVSKEEGGGGRAENGVGKCHVVINMVM